PYARWVRLPRCRRKAAWFGGLARRGARDFTRGRRAPPVAMLPRGGPGVPRTCRRGVKFSSGCRYTARPSKAAGRSPEPRTETTMALPMTIKTPEEIEKMRVAGRLAASVLDMIGPHVTAGVTTGELDAICHRFIVEDLEAIPAPLNYRGFPKSICTSVNHVICHGIPGDKKLKNGDIINIDITVIKDGYHGDTSRMYAVGQPSIRAARLIETCYESMKLGIEQVRPGAR